MGAVLLPPPATSAPAAAARPTGVAPFSTELPSASQPAAGGGLCARIRVGTLEFNCTGLGLPALFETSGLRVLLRAVESCRQGMMLEPGRWRDDAPTTQRQPLRFGRDVSSDGCYKARVACAFDEELDVPLASDRPGVAAPSLLAVEIWLERRTMLERLDSLLERVGFGTGLPEFDRTWLGRALVELPPPGEDRMPSVWPVTLTAHRLSGAVGAGSSVEDEPMPQSISLGVEWVTAEYEDAEGVACGRSI